LHPSTPAAGRRAGRRSGPVGRDDRAGRSRGGAAAAGRRVPRRGRPVAGGAGRVRPDLRGVPAQLRPHGRGTDADCRAVARALKPGGRFVTAKSNFAEPTAAFPAGRAYGFSGRVEGELVEGAPIVWEFFLPEGSFEVTNYYLSVATMEEAF